MRTFLVLLGVLLFGIGITLALVAFFYGLWHDAHFLLGVLGGFALFEFGHWGYTGHLFWFSGGSEAPTLIPSPAAKFRPRVVEAIPAPLPRRS